MATGITRGQRLRGDVPVLRDDRLYFTDNGRVVCGKHAGNMARFTGYDVSGQRVEEITDDTVREALRRCWPEPTCETCGCKAKLISVA